MEILKQRVENLEKSLYSPEEVYLTEDIVKRVVVLEKKLNSLLTPLQKRFLAACLN